MATIESSAAHDRVGRAKAGMHDSVASCCVVIEGAMRARHTRPWASATGEFCRDKEFYVSIDLDSDEVPMSRPDILGRD